MGQARPPTKTAAEAGLKAEARQPKQDIPITSGGAPVADFLHGPLIQTIVMADRKAGILFTLVTAALLYLLTRPPVFAVAWIASLWCAVIAALVLAAICAFAVIFPRIGQSSRDVFFWGGIARYPDAESYRAAVADLDGARLQAEKLAYCYNLARICARKFQYLRIAMIATAVGLVLFIVMLLVTRTAANSTLPPIS